MYCFLLICKWLYILKNKDIQFIYSPAHIEEIAVIKRKVENIEVRKKYIYQHLRIISKLTNNNELLPSDKGILLNK